MLLFFFLKNKYLWVLAWFLQSVGYWSLLQKIGDFPSYAIIPFFAEWRLSKYVFARSRTFIRPFLIALVLVFAGFFLNPLVGMGRLFIYIAAIIYYFFLIRLYNRLRKGYKKTFLFYLLMILFPPLFLFLLGRSFRRHFHGQGFKVGKRRTRLLRYAFNALIVLLCVLEIVAVTLGVAFFTVRRQQPRFLADYLLQENRSKTKDVSGDGDIMSREEALGDSSSIIETASHSRDYFYPDHSKDESVVVMEYIIGSNLENAAGLASANITQMVDASKGGKDFAFVVQAGGSSRWFTDEIADNSYGRYVIKDGETALAETLDDDLCMAEPDALADFIRWAHDNYPADRYMLVLWDHGGGFSLGYGSDDLNKRKDHDTMLVNEMADALEKGGVIFDAIGFDACLMQNFETALAMEPYADYYIASEEVEGGYGWFYTSAFKKLAQDPGIPTLEFAHELISAYDVYNTAIKDGKEDTGATLSVVDLTMVRPIYEQLAELFDNCNQAILQDSEYYADISLSASKAYAFSGNDQIDLIGYLQILDSLDYKETICKDDACQILIDSVRASIPYRNRDSADGINGIALTFPNSSAASYSDIYEQFKAFGMDRQMEFYNNYYSIMTAQQGGYTLYKASESEWYVQGFEDYDTSEVYIDIPLSETEYGYKIEVPEKIKKIIADIQVDVYQRDGDRLRYLGRDYVGSQDLEGETYIDMDDKWIHINNIPISYQAGQVRETEEGTVFTGTTRGKLNGTDEIVIQIEWDTYDEENDAMEGRIAGYTFADEPNPFMSKGMNELKAGDRVVFLFDYYDRQGNLLGTETYGRTLYVTNPELLFVRDGKLKDCDIVFNGVLTDVYQREMSTEQIEYHIK